MSLSIRVDVGCKDSPFFVTRLFPLHQNDQTDGDQFTLNDSEGKGD